MTAMLDLRLDALHLLSLLLMPISKANLHKFSNVVAHGFVEPRSLAGSEIPFLESTVIRRVRTKRRGSCLFVPGLRN